VEVNNETFALVKLDQPRGSRASNPNGTADAERMKAKGDPYAQADLPGR
jgi:hypothetical protein